MRSGSEELTRFRDQALARATTEPPDAGYHLDVRLGWRLWVAGIAAALDRLHRRGRGGARIAWVLLDAFHAFLPLVDPGWWRAYPPARPNAAGRRELRRVHKTRRRILRRGLAGTVLGEMTLWICDAAEVYLGAGDAVGVDRCRRLMNAMQGIPESESADLRSAPGCGRTPWGHDRDVPGSGISTTAAGGIPPTATTPGRVKAGPGKEDDV